MFSRTQLSASTCRRCHLRFLLHSGQLRGPSSQRQTALSQTQTTALPTTRNFSTTNGLRDDERMYIPQPTESEDSSQKSDTSDTFPKQPRPPFKKIFPHGKVRRSKGQYVKEDKDKLDIRSLGANSEVIILRDYGDTPKNNREEQKQNKPEEDDHLTDDARPGLTEEEVLRQVNAGAESMGTADIIQAIEALRVPTGLLMDDNTYAEMADRIEKGFTKRQLEIYQKAMSSKGATMSKKSPARARIRVMQSWKPLTVDTNASGGNPSSKPELRMTPKVRAIRDIILDVWGAVHKSESLLTGTILLRLQPQGMMFLQAGESGSRLERIAAARNVRFSVDRNRLHLTGDKAVVGAVVRDIEATLSSSCALVINPSILMEQLQKSARQESQKRPSAHVASDESELEAFRSDFKNLEKTFNTMIITERDSLLILGDDKTSVIDTRRALTALLALPRSVQRSTLLWTPDPHLPGYLMDTPRVNNSLLLSPGVVSNEGFQRLIYPTKKQQKRSTKDEDSTIVVNSSEQVDRELASNEEQIISPNIKSDIISFLRTSGVNDVASSSFWEMEPIHQIAATPGYALHRTPTMEIVGLSKVKNINEILVPPQDSKRLFIGTIPGVRRLLTNLSSSIDAEQQPSQITKKSDRNVTKTLTFKLVPNLWSPNAPKDILAYPQLEIVFAASPVSKSTNTPLRGFLGLSAVINEQTLDVLGPGQPSDIQFINRTLVPASRDNALKNSHLKAFVSYVINSIKGYGAIRAPDTVTIEIPEWMKAKVDKTDASSDQRHLKDGQAQKAPREKQKNRGKNGAPASTSSEDPSSLGVEYLFLSMESRESIPASFQDYPVTYVATERGRFGGSSTKLLIEPPEIARSTDITTTEFVDKALALWGMVNSADLGRLPVRGSRIGQQRVQSFAKEEMRELYEAGDAASSNMFKVNEVIAESILTTPEHVHDSSTSSDDLQQREEGIAVQST